MLTKQPNKRAHGKGTAKTGGKSLFGKTLLDYITGEGDQELLTADKIEWTYNIC